MAKKGQETHALITLAVSLLDLRRIYLYLIHSHLSIDITIDNLLLGLLFARTRYLTQ